MTNPLSQDGLVRDMYWRESVRERAMAGPVGENPIRTRSATGAPEVPANAPAVEATRPVDQFETVNGPRETAPVLLAQAPLSRTKQNDVRRIGAQSQHLIARGRALARGESDAAAMEAWLREANALRPRIESLIYELEQTSSDPNRTPAERRLASANLQMLRERSAALDAIDASFEPGLQTPNGAAAGFMIPRPSNVINGTHTTAANTAVQILQTMGQGRPPFRPDLGLGGVQWFVTDGSPFAGATSGSGTTIPVDIEVPRGSPVFREEQLLALFNEEMGPARNLAEQQLRAREGLPDDRALNRRQQRTVTRNAERIAERAMWRRVGEQIGRSRHGVGQVRLENSRFSRSGNGTFTLTAKPQNVRVRGGAQALVDLIRKSGTAVDEGMQAAATRYAQSQRWAGRLQGAVKVGGRVLFIFGAAADGYRIITAEDKLRESAKVVGGWAGATAAGGAFASWASPSLATGPWGWLAYGAGTLVAGAGGYFVGEAVAEEAYELVVDGDPLFIGPND